MLLMDTLTDLAERIKAKGLNLNTALTPAGERQFGSLGREPISRWMAAYTDLVNLMHGAPRFLLDANATRTAVELNLGRPKITLEAMRHIHIPYQRLWVEWDDGDRQKLRERFADKQDYSELRPMPGRVGFLLQADPGGRSGTATWAWDTPDANLSPREQLHKQISYPNIGAIQPYFDLDRRFDLPPDRIEGLSKGNLGRLWQDNPVQLAALSDIWRTAQHVPSEAGMDYFEALGNDPLAISLSYSDVVGEYIMIWAIMLMITASRDVVDYTAINRDKLNKARRKRNAVPLLDHTQVTMHLTPHEHRPVVREELGYSRKSPRVHLVSSYLARRGNRHWLVAPYFRGKGKTIHRVVHVKG
jgi:hypothetical protein